MFNLQKGSLQPRLSYEGKHKLTHALFLDYFHLFLFQAYHQEELLSSVGVQVTTNRKQQRVQLRECREFNQSKLWKLQRDQQVETLGTIKSSTSGNAVSCRELNQWKLRKLWRVQQVETLGAYKGGQSSQKKFKIPFKL